MSTAPSLVETKLKSESEPKLKASLDSSSQSNHKPDVSDKVKCGKRKKRKFETKKETQVEPQNINNKNTNNQNVKSEKPNEQYQLTEREQWTEYVQSILQQQSVDFKPPQNSRLLTLSQLLGLQEFEQDLIMLHWVCAFSPELRQHILSNEPLINQLSPLLISRLLNYPPCYRLGTESPLILWDILTEQLLSDGSIFHQLDPQIISWLEGQHHIDPWLLGRIRLIGSSFALPHWNLSDYQERIAEHIANGESCRVLLHTEDKCLAEAFAAALAEKLRLSLAQINTDYITPEQAYGFSVRLHRQCFLDRIAPVLEPCQSFFCLPQGLQPFPVQFIVGVSGEQNVVENTHDILVEFSRLSGEDRQAIWHSNFHGLKSWPKKEAEKLIYRDHLTATEINGISAKAPENLSEHSA